MVLMVGKCQAGLKKMYYKKEAVDILESQN